MVLLLSKSIALIIAFDHRTTTQTGTIRRLHKLNGFSPYIKSGDAVRVVMLGSDV